MVEMRLIFSRCLNFSNFFDVKKLNFKDANDLYVTSSNMSYPLYYTLNKKLKKTDMTIVERKGLAKGLSALTDEDAKIAVIMLVAEHYKIENQNDSKCFFQTQGTEKAEKGRNNTSPSVILPYNMRQEGSNLIFDVDDFPSSLRWILHKFLKTSVPKV